MKRDGLLLAALPSGGSDWVATCIADANPNLRYSREFFCPTINWRMAARLEQTVGDTMAENMARMCHPRMVHEIEDLLNDTWRRTDRNFTKENYLPFQLEPFGIFFDVIVLIRSFEETFPPQRHRVMQWYEHFFGALRANGMLTRRVIDLGVTPMTRATIGYYCFARRLVVAAQRLQAPLLTTRFLLDGSLEEIQRALPGNLVNAPATAAMIVATRKEVPRPDGEYQEQWQQAKDVFARLVDRDGPVIAEAD